MPQYNPKIDIITWTNKESKTITLPYDEKKLQEDIQWIKKWFEKKYEKG